MSDLGVRRGKAALSSGCKAHPAIAPAGSNRSSNGGDEMAEAFGYGRHQRIMGMTLKLIWINDPGRDLSQLRVWRFVKWEMAVRGSA
jgi:hypothetical protein